jgi:tRNA(Ile)-lysidine synthase
LQEVKAVQRRLVRRWLGKTSGDLWGIGFEHVEAVLQLVHQGPPQGRLSLPGGWNLVRNYDVIRLARENRKWDGSPAYRYVLPRQGELIIPEAGWKLRSSYEASPSIEQPRDDLEALFDTAFLPGDLTVRNFRPGDRYQPLGMRGHKKVKDLFIEKKIPFPQRRSLPLLFCGEEILWIPRCGRSEVAKAGPGTKEILKVRLAPLNGA